MQCIRYTVEAFYIATMDRYKDLYREVSKAPNKSAKTQKVERKLENTSSQ